MSLFRLIYVSRQAISMSQQDLAQIIVKSIRNNESRGLTGVLAYGGQSFLQVLEGEIVQLNALFETIVRDRRHKDVCILDYSKISHRLFGEWEMEMVSAFDLNLPPHVLFDSPYAPFPFDGDLALDFLLRIKERLKTPQAWQQDAQPQPQAAQSQPQPQSHSAPQPWEQASSSQGQPWEQTGHLQTQPWEQTLQEGSTPVVLGQSLWEQKAQGSG